LIIYSLKKKKKKENKIEEDFKFTFEISIFSGTLSLTILSISWQVLFKILYIILSEIVILFESKFLSSALYEFKSNGVILI